ncbi:unnamed protein product [Prorocentrum cordatum]|uniref:Uncharacterized protein n=1 Tax=Prorocentrum cordatum TaxID=2364126 RepID=A0ABN9PK80_9DINO|nr:unnamed protein product [Polarella glacialis]
MAWEASQGRLNSYVVLDRGDADGQWEGGIVAQCDFLGDSDIKRVRRWPPERRSNGLPHEGRGSGAAAARGGARRGGRRARARGTRLSSRPELERVPRRRGGASPPGRRPVGCYGCPPGASALPRGHVI